jgi:hypothetical protein
LEDEDDRLWQEVGTILIEKSQPWLEQRANLFGRKYFHDPEDSGGNIVEAWMNSSFDVFRSARIGEPRFEASQGVSPWEATARLEPFVKLQEGNEIGIVGGLGTTYHLVPDHDGREDWQSRWVQRVGVRAGVGFLQQSGETGDFVFGGAVQIRSLTVWAMYDPEERDVFLAVGSGDSRWLGELTTWFD